MGRNNKESPAYLGIDTSIKGLKMGLFGEEGSLLASYIDYQNPASYSLSLALEVLLKAYNLKLEDIKSYMVIKGPGSFTGLKVGISFVKGLTLATNRPIISINTLKALALSAISSTSIGEGNIISLIPALRGVHFFAYFCLRKGLLEEISYGLGKPEVKESAFIATIEKFEGHRSLDSKHLIFSNGPHLESWGREAVILFKKGMVEDPILLEPWYGRDIEIQKLVKP